MNGRALARLLLCDVEVVEVVEEVLGGLGLPPNPGLVNEVHEEVVDQGAGLLGKRTETGKRDA